jgi:hypothetical protein
MMRLAIVMMMGCGMAAGQTVVTSAKPSASGEAAPAVSSLKLAVQTLTVDKWKAPKPVKDGVAVNLNSIRKDVMETLPGLLGAADAAPGSVAAGIPVERNLAALYDVVLRVFVVADAAAPPEQTAAIEDAMHRLEGIRRTYGDRLQDLADGQERKMTALEKVASAPPPPPVAAPVCPAPPTPAKKKKKTSPPV